MATRMQQRRGTASQWVSSNDGDGPTLNAGEIGFETDTNKFKIGDGVSAWIDLAYFADADGSGGASLDDYIPLTQKGVANGVAELNSDGKLASAQIPNLDEITQDILDTSLVAGTGLDKTYNDAAGTYTMDIDSTVATLTGTQTLTNKTLTSPVISTISNTGTLTLPTSTGTVALTSDITTAINNLVDGAPVALDTLNELAAALGDDASYASTITTALGLKAPLADPTFTGTVTIPTLTLTNPLSASNGGTGLSSLGDGVATFLGTPSSANFASMISDEIGTGNVILSELATNNQTASYTLALADKAKVVEMAVGSANNLTVPTNSSVAYPVGTQIHIVQVGSGQTTVVASGGVTINTATTLKLRAQWSAATLIKRAENTWVLAGDLATS